MHAQIEPWMWWAFGAFIILMLWLDLKVFNKKSHTVSIRESLGYTIMWMSLAVVFTFCIYFYLGADKYAEGKAIEFVTGYVIEESLSVDNLFVILLIFSYFKVDPSYQHKVLFWGIFGALVMRLVMIMIGIQLIEMFSWIMFVFGGFLVFTGIRMAFGQEREIHPEQNPIVRIFKRFMPVTADYHGDKFFVIENAKRYATPLFIVVLIVEATDLVFAVDSIPAILAVTRDPFIVYTSNAFAILGLRSLFFALAGIMDIFHYLKYGLSVILTFIGVKMVIAEWVHISTEFSLLVVGGILMISIVASLFSKPKSAV